MWRLRSHTACIYKIPLLTIKQNPILRTACMPHATRCNPVSHQPAWSVCLCRARRQNPPAAKKMHLVHLLTHLPASQFSPSMIGLTHAAAGLSRRSPKKASLGEQGDRAAHVQK
jgi:hypothetical protein